jgi:hypothetical protein
MKIITPLLLAAGTIALVAACHSKKKSSTVATTTPPATTTVSTPTTSGSPVMLMRSPDGIYPPGNEELAAIQTTYKDVTIEKLKQGHTIYTFGDCAKCHRAQSIYKYTEERWKTIIDDMAKRANLQEEEKDAVYKYVLSIKAVQPK